MWDVETIVGRADYSYIRELPEEVIKFTLISETG